MDARYGFLVLLVFARNWASEARYLVYPDISGVENACGNVDLCTMCEEYSTFALDYLSENNTQAKVMEVLHNTCLQMHGLKEQCLMLVDYYAPLFFLEVSSVQPEGFCKKIGLCRNARMFSSSEKQNKCDLCHRAVDEVLIKLKDPESKLEIIELLLKACSSVEKYMKKCKSMVFEFGPLIITNAEKFIEQTDICATLHACSMSKADTEVGVFEGKIEMVISS